MTTEKEIKLMLKLNDINNENHALRIEVDKLKRLLKECKAKTSELLKKYAELDQDCYYEHGHKWSEQEFKQENKDVDELLTKIEEVLK